MRFATAKDDVFMPPLNVRTSDGLKAQIEHPKFVATELIISTVWITFTESPF